MSECFSYCGPCCCSSCFVSIRPSLAPQLVKVWETRHDWRGLFCESDHGIILKHNFLRPPPPAAPQTHIHHHHNPRQNPGAWSTQVKKTVAPRLSPSPRNYPPTSRTSILVACLLRACAADAAAAARGAGAPATRAEAGGEASLQGQGGGHVPGGAG